MNNFLLKTYFYFPTSTCIIIITIIKKRVLYHIISMQFHKYKTVDHLSLSSPALLLIIIALILIYFILNIVTFLCNVKYIAVMVKNSSSVDAYMVIILLDTKVTVSQPITKYINENKDYNLLFLIQCLKHIFFLGFYWLINNNSINLIDCWKNYSRT